MCLYPRLIKNRKYVSNNKNGGKIPAVPDERMKYVPIGCGNCMECRKQEQLKWQVRLNEEIKERDNGIFVTLTFSNESIKKLINENEYLQKLEGYELDNQIAIRAVRLFLERWRKRFKKSVRHWLITELGHNGTENIHLHGILWTNISLSTIRNLWQYGYIWPRENDEKSNYVGERTVNYIVKYVRKIDVEHKYYKSVVLASKGIGSGYLKRQDALSNKFKGTETNEAYKTPTGHKLSLPIYYRNKIYTEEERAKLWIIKLDEDVRYVGGIKVKNSNEKGYYNLLEYYREMNTRMGYGNDEKNWDREQYEIQRRAIMMAKRLGNNKNTN